MHDLNLWHMTLKLIAAAVLGGLIGYEREAHGRPAGLRTHILVSMGSALFTLCSYSIAGTSNDPGRITAQIVTGIGFLGAGTIMRQGNVVRGLTTAASIWAVAAIGISMAIGGIMAYLAGIATLLVVMTLYLVQYLERYLLLKQNERSLSIVVRDEKDAISNVISVLTKNGATIRTMGTEESDEPSVLVLRIRTRLDRNFDENVFNAGMLGIGAVIRYSWDQY